MDYAYKTRKPRHSNNKKQPKQYLNFKSCLSLLSPPILNNAPLVPKLFPETDRLNYSSQTGQLPDHTIPRDLSCSVKLIFINFWRIFINAYLLRIEPRKQRGSGWYANAIIIKISEP